MEGIIILSQNLDYTNRVLGIVLTLPFGCMFILGIILFYLSIKDKFYTSSILFGIFLIVSGLVLGFGTIPQIFAKPTTQYKATIDKKVSLKDFNEKYKIIEQDGEIYTIVEREK